MGSEAMVQKKENKLVTVRDLLERQKDKFAAVLPKFFPVERFLRVVMAAINKTPVLAECSQASLLLSVNTAAQLGLEIGVLGRAYLVPFKNKGQQECQLIIGYSGLIDLARRSGEIESIEARAVLEGDHFVCKFGLGPVLEHVPQWEGAADRKVIAFYGVAKLRDGGRQIEVMTLADVTRIMKSTQSKGEYGPWRDHFVEMGRKTVIRRLAKYLPLSPELAEALHSEDSIDVEHVNVSETPRGVNALRALTQPGPQVEPPHDPTTGEVLDEAALKAEAAERERAELAEQKS